jgi:4-oxalocrotonate tautomerase
MPYINLQITKGATREQKKRIVEEFTESLVRHLGKNPEHIHIVIDEIEDENWGFAGMLTDDYRDGLKQKDQGA